MDRAAAGAVEDALSAPDISTLCDLGQVYKCRENPVVRVRAARVLGVAAAGILPMLPLYASTLTIEELMRKILGTVIGGGLPL